MFLPRVHKESQQVDLTSRLETPEGCQRSEERSRAQWLEMQVQREELAVGRDRFELIRDKIVFGLEFVLAMTMLLAAVIVVVLNPGLAPLLLGGSGIGGVATFLRHRAASP